MHCKSFKHKEFKKSNMLYIFTEIPEEDPFFKQHGQRCMHFVRSMPAPQLGCTFGYGEQQNQITGFHDGSNVYGSDSEEVEKLREHKVSTCFT